VAAGLTGLRDGCEDISCRFLDAMNGLDRSWSGVFVCTVAS